MPAPRHALLDGSRISTSVRRARLAFDQRDRIDIAPRRQPFAKRLRVGHRRRQRRALHCRRDRLQPAEREREQIAALAGGESVDLVDHHALQTGEQLEAVGIAEQQRQRFRAWSAARAAACARWRFLRSDGVSPLRVSTRIGSPISSTGVRGCAARRAPAPSAARRRACAAPRAAASSPKRDGQKAASVGRNPASVLPAPVSATSSACCPHRSRPASRSDAAAPASRALRTSRQSPQARLPALGWQVSGIGASAIFKAKHGARESSSGLRTSRLGRVLLARRFPYLRARHRG